MLRVAILACCGLLAQALVIQDLGGKDWSVANGNETIRVKAHVPGSIHSDLIRGGVLTKGDIYAENNDFDYRWVSYDNWTWERNFDVNENVLKQEHVYLTAHGLDTVGSVTLNGHLLGPVENMFVRHKWSVKQLLKPKDNQLVIAFESAPLYTNAHHEEHVKQGYPIPVICRPPGEKGICHYNYIRKMQASYGWDWGPAFPTQGIWRPIQLEAYSKLLLRTVSVETVPKGTNWHLNTKVYLENVPSASLTATLDLYLSGTRLETKTFTVHFNAEGDAFVQVSVDVPANLEIKTWYPNGVGECKSDCSPLYDLKVVVHDEHESVDKSIRIGFRTVELAQEALHAPKAKDPVHAYYFKVNGLQIFAKGVNWIPAHHLYEELTEEHIYDLLLSAKLANMNMVRIWGGGYYEDDKFYEIADKLGLLIYHDMMFAASLYPADDHFLSLVKPEIRQQVRRLQHHPSIAVWCGNNENENNLAQERWSEIKAQPERYRADYVKLNINVTMKIIEEEDMTRPFVSSSPSNGVDDVRKGYIGKANPHTGEMHFYISSGDVWDWHRYPKSKFVSEYGFQSCSSVGLLERYINKSELYYPFSPAVTHRQHAGGKNLVDMMSLHFYLPSGKGLHQLEDFIYLAQIHQAMAMKIETEFYRRNRDLTETGEGFTMGALYWQLNEIWPAFSWSSLEFDGKWKVLQYYVRNFFDNLLVNAYEDGDHLKVVIVRDDHVKEKTEYHVGIEVFDWSKTEPIHSEYFNHATEGPMSVTLVFNQPTEQYLTKAKCPNRTHCFVRVSVAGPGGTVKKENFLLLAQPKDSVGLHITPIHTKISEPVHTATYSKFNIELQADHVAPFVWLDIEPNMGVKGIFSDNAFILAGKRDVVFETKDTKLTSAELGKLLKVKSLRDVKYWV